MGVRGLSSFFDQNPVLSKEYKLHDTPVVIDGNNLAHVLYFTSKLDCTFGGDYNRFASAVRKYLGSYLQCNIRPIVVFDGSYDRSEKKLQTVFQRSKQRLTNVQHIAKYGFCSGKVLPILAIEVMKNVMKSMGILFVQCDYEADEHITAVANYYKCPVISQDSDFYIFDIKNGFIRLDSINSSVCVETDETDTFKYLKCKIYHIDTFLSYFPGIDKSVLPLFGTLVGNDYVHINSFDNFFSKIQLPKFKSKLKVSQRHQKMIGLLSWLKFITLKDAVEQVLSYLKKTKREKVRSLIDRAMEGYATEFSDMCTFIENYTNSSSLLDCSKSDLVTFSGKALPPWFVERFRAGHINPFLMNVLGIRKAFLPSQVEEPSFGSSFECSVNIRRALYGILFSYELEDTADLHKSIGVDEYDCHKGTLQKNYVEAVYTNLNNSVVKLGDLSAMSPKEAKHLIAEVLGEEVSYFSSLLPSLHLLFGSIRYWLRSCKPKPQKEFLYGLIVMLLYLMLEHEDHSMSCDDRSSERLCDRTHVEMFRTITQEEKLSFMNRMKKYCQKPQHNNAHPLNVRIIHAYSQLQTCLLYILYLNMLLESPFVNTEVQACFCGTLLYNLTRDMLTRPFPRLFVSELLGRNSKLDTLFLEWEGKIMENILEANFTAVEPKASKKKKKTKQLHSEDVQSKADRNSSTDNRFQTGITCEESVDVFI